MMLIVEEMASPSPIPYRKVEILVNGKEVAKGKIYKITCGRSAQRAGDLGE